ncbi:hypothetical protein EJ04DRAFT_553860 [Polyplosphaeria fusca]|uniref:Uncharacterized protein n=1 Tax=Polyplosphaeria fusca TaxID=682080 RepID=A0A9P4QWW5_9PLEO|nr:hypothetical protein EJ04DRAFT_553860 [Polyplosphaeria fusca]
MTSPPPPLTRCASMSPSPPLSPTQIASRAEFDKNLAAANAAANAVAEQKAAARSQEMLRQEVAWRKDWLAKNQAMRDLGEYYVLPKPWPTWLLKQGVEHPVLLEGYYEIEMQVRGLVTAKIKELAESEMDQKMWREYEMLMGVQEEHHKDKENGIDKTILGAVLDGFEEKVKEIEEMEDWFPFPHMQAILMKVPALKERFDALKEKVEPQNPNGKRPQTGPASKEERSSKRTKSRPPTSRRGLSLCALRTQFHGAAVSTDEASDQGPLSKS